MSSLRGKVVFITGGARGIGAEVARRLHAKGVNLVLTDLDEVALQDLASDLGGDQVLALTAAFVTSRRCRPPPAGRSIGSAASTS